MRPVTYRVELTETARDGIQSLSPTDQQLVVKQLEKLHRAPQLGEPLGNKSGVRLAGYQKLYAAQKRCRIIYYTDTEERLVTVIAIGPRANMKVYAVADAEAARRRLRQIGGT